MLTHYKTEDNSGATGAGYTKESHERKQRRKSPGGGKRTSGCSARLMQGSKHSGRKCMYRREAWHLPLALKIDVIVDCVSRGPIGKDVTGYGIN